MGTAALDDLISSIRRWPSDDIAELFDFARIVEARRKGIYEVPPEERAAIADGLAQARRGEFVPDDEMEKIWARLGA